MYFLTITHKGDPVYCVFILTVKYELFSHLAERQGEREDMQDAHIIIKDYASLFPNLHPSM